MKQRMSKQVPYYPCLCHFVPPYVIENIAKSGNEAARVTAVQDAQLRAERTARPVDMNAVSGVMMPPPGTAGRSIFNSNNTWAFQVFLVRGEGDPVTGDDAINDSYDFAGNVRQYYKDVLGRNSIDNLGMNQVHNVHYGVNYDNAFWDGSQMTYGDGDGVMFVNFSRDLDVIGHELTHGVTQYTAQLNYFSQSGALNESFSDVLGTVIQQTAMGQTAHNADWLIGDGIMGPSLFGEALRSMKAPGTAYDNNIMGKDPQPDHMSNYYAGPADNQGVHINSGIPNKAFYLVSMDIGTDCAALIWYTALQSLWPTAAFSDMVYIACEATRALVKNGQVPNGSTQSVRAAFRAVGL